MTGENDGAYIPATMNDRKRVFGVTLHLLMSRCGFNQSELGRRTGMAKAQISRYLNGEIMPQLPQVFRLQEALGVTNLGFWLCYEQVARLDRVLPEPSVLADEPPRPPRESLLEAVLTLVAGEEATGGVDGTEAAGDAERGDGGRSAGAGATLRELLQVQRRQMDAVQLLNRALCRDAEDAD